MSNTQRVTLSSQGNARRTMMLEELSHEMQRVHRRRAIRRSTIAVMSVLMLIVGGLVVLNLPQQISIPQVNTNVASLAHDIPSAEFVQTDPTILSRWMVDRTGSSVVMVDDDVLLELLAQMERPTGLIRWDSQVWLTNPITENGDNNPTKDDSESSALRNDVEA